MQLPESRAKPTCEKGSFPHAGSRHSGACFPGVLVDVDKIFGLAVSSNIANGDSVLRVWRMHAPDSLSRSAAVCAENGVWAWACLVGATGGGRGRGRGRSAVGLHLLACRHALAGFGLGFGFGFGSFV